MYLCPEKTYNNNYLMMKILNLLIPFKTIHLNKKMEEENREMLKKTLSKV